jgi:hypothetical protein
VSPRSEWTVYRTRFLIRARKLDAPLVFVDVLGREHSGRKGDYLVESPDGSRRIAPREIFEDIYVPMEEPGLRELRPASRDLRVAAVDPRRRAMERRTAPLMS